MIKSYPPNKQASSGNGNTASQTVVVTRVSELANDKGYITSDDLPEEVDPHVSEWARQEQKPSYTAEEVGALPESTTIPQNLQDLHEDTNHRTVSDEEKSSWNAKQDAISDLSTIRAGAALGATAIQEHQDISGKQDVLTFDSTPTASSTNPVTSGGVKSALDGKADASNTYTKVEINNLIVPADRDTIIVSALPASGQANTIYRVPGSNSYADYGWDGTQFIKLAEYATAYSGRVWY